MEKEKFRKFQQEKFSNATKLVTEGKQLFPENRDYINFLILV